MQCPSCNTELPKKAKVCPKCGTAIGKPKGNLRVMAIIGFVVMLIASLLPMVQSGEKIKLGLYPKAYAFGYMNISMPVMWYLFIACIVVAIILVVARKEILSIIPVAVSVVITIVSFLAFDFNSVEGKVMGGGLKFVPHSLTDLLSNGYNGNSYHIGCGLIVLAIGVVIAIAGCFIDVVKPFKKDLHVDTKYLSNSLNQSLSNKIYYYRGFYLMFLPVFVMIMLFNYWPMLGCRYAFTCYIIGNPYYMGLYHFVTMFTNDVYFWQAFRNTLILSIIKLFLNTGAAVIISLLLNEITNMIFKKTVQTIIYLPHFMSWVVVASVFKMMLAPYDIAPVNSILMNMGLIDTPIDFMNSAQYWRGTFYVMNVWKDTGWGTILFLATLSGISPDLYEAAQIDGANRFKRLIYITLPALANTIITVFILNLAKVMNLFESVFVLQSPITYTKSQVLQTYVYVKTFGGGNSDYGYTTAVGLFKSFVGMILVLGCNWASKKVRGRGIV
ncbi:ABC transporter permease subunit [Lachnospira eligens]|jgi:multiple sugar transport system permease protein|uniref:Multiple sugar transport system permease protein n=1 Tax=Lachnospira eligens (strain ATCC 27750 / DSM 3376 / VPI C15-48 / C15-B4) TaxID=515620 RepID=C4Z2L3_LACE2|nr:ABC transporter permease subunit [Lachnospira eligens]ACR72588.1 multiple sugar transport system permease protein [[Eubacterium] eligens ATCC 27750]UEA98365.1 ABC transporter permease subunit [Lachnospira eligens]